MITAGPPATLGWYQVAANPVTLPLFAVLAERLLGRWQWVALFAAGTVGGQVAAYAWHDPGGGDSIAICGLAAGVAITLLTRRAAPPKFAADAVVYYVAALTGWGFSGLRAAALACVAAGLFLNGARLAKVDGAERVALAGTVVCALALATTDHDLHGASLTSGMLMMSILLIARNQPRRQHHGLHQPENGTLRQGAGAPAGQEPAPARAPGPPTRAAGG